MDNMENKPVKECEYTLRPLMDEDLWPVLDIVGKVIPDDMNQVFALVASGEKNIKEVGYDVGFKLVTAIIKNLPKVHKEVYAFLSSVSGIPAEEIRKMKIGTTPRMIWDIAKEIGNADFFGALSKLS